MNETLYDAWRILCAFRNGARRCRRWLAERDEYIGGAAAVALSMACLWDMCNGGWQPRDRRVQADAPAPPRPAPLPPVPIVPPQPVTVTFGAWSVLECDGRLVFIYAGNPRFIFKPDGVMVCGNVGLSEGIRKEAADAKR